MTLGVVPALGGSLSDFDRHGQLARLVNAYFPAYLEHFERIRFFTYENESLASFTSDPTLLGRVEIVRAPQLGKRWTQGLALAVGAGRRALRDCAVVRVLQAPGALPAALAGACYVTTYGYSYARFTTAPRRVVAAKRLAMTVGLRLLLRRAEAVIVTSPAGKSEAGRLGARRLWSIPNGVDTAAFSPRAGAKHWDVAFVGRLNEPKNVGVLLDALAQLPDRCRAVVVGEGGQRSALEQQAGDGRLDVTFLGVRPQREIVSVLQSAKVFVLPSRFEGHPKALLEAMAVGMPWIGTDIPGVRELASDPDRQIVRVGSATDLARSLALLLADEQLCAQIGADAREQVIRRFDLARLLDDEGRRLREIACVRARSER